MTEVLLPLDPWQSAVVAAQLFALDPVGLGGICVRAGAGPVRDRWLALLRDALPPDVPVRRCPSSIADDRLLGGIDLTATLKSGRPVAQRGLLAEADGGIVLLAMAERFSEGQAARMTAAMDSQTIALERDGLTLALPARFGVVALDEGVTVEERPPDALMSRMAFWVDLQSIGLAQAAARSAPARGGITDVVAAAPDLVAALCETAVALGVDSIRAPLLALRCARAAAAWEGRQTITVEDVALAAQLVLAPRATRIPAEARDEQDDVPPQDTDSDNNEEPSPPPPPPSDDRDADSDASPPTTANEMADQIQAAAKAAIPERLLAALTNASLRATTVQRAGRAGAVRNTVSRGRPTGVRRGDLRSGARLSLVDTLRAAAPWQSVRRAAPQAGTATHIHIQRDDFRIKRFAQRSESTVIFVVDASGSSAFQRLAEAKGAVELVLAEAYVARTQVALIAFRGRTADLLLPPTRSLVRARSRLAELPGGGTTPLAAGLDSAVLLALGERAKGHTPLVILLTDGKANVGREPGADKAQARADALAAGARLKAANIAAVFIDTGRWPSGDSAALAAAMGARYEPLPFLNAGAVRDLARPLVQAAHG